MTGIDNIKKRILEDALKTVNNQIEHASRKADAILEEARLETEIKRKAIVEKAGKKAADIHKRILALAEIELKKKKLTVRQELVREVFDKALEMLCNMPEDEYCDFLASIILSSLPEKYEIILSPADRQRIGENLVEKTKGFLKGQEKNARIRLSSATADIRGGLILRSEDMEINYSFEAIIRADQEMLEELARSGLELA